MAESPKTTRKRAQIHRSHPGLWTILVVALLVAGIAGLVLWIRTDLDSATAEMLRRSIGIPAAESTTAETEAEPPAVAAEVPDAEAPKPIQVAPDPPPPPPEPETETLSWAGLAERPALWPDSVQITFTEEIPILYRGQTFGSMFFTPGQLVAVEKVGRDGRITGIINRMHVVLSANSTDLADWFRASYGGTYELDTDVSPPAEQSIDATMDESAEKTILRELRIWCNLNYGSIAFEFAEDAIHFNWAEQDDIPTDYRVEAREIARKYLQIQAANGGTDNYAACHIFDPHSGELLGTGGIFMPELTW